MIIIIIIIIISCLFTDTITYVHCTCSEFQIWTVTFLHHSRLPIYQWHFTLIYLIALRSNLKSNFYDFITKTSAQSCCFPQQEKKQENILTYLRIFSFQNLPILQFFSLSLFTPHHFWLTKVMFIAWHYESKSFFSPEIQTLGNFSGGMTFWIDGPSLFQKLSLSLPLTLD